MYLVGVRRARPISRLPLVSPAMTRSLTGRALAVVGVVVALGCGVGHPSAKSAGSDSEDKIAVPNLVGAIMDTVYQQLDDVGLVASAETAIGVSDWTAEAIVLSTTPPAETRVSPGTTVKILEATKAEIGFFTKPMPNLVGTRWLDAASGDLSAAYFYFDATWRKPRGKETSGTIVAQTPKPGAKLKMDRPSMSQSPIGHPSTPEVAATSISPMLTGRTVADTPSGAKMVGRRRIDSNGDSNRPGRTGPARDAGGLLSEVIAATDSGGRAAQNLQARHRQWGSSRSWLFGRVAVASEPADRRPEWTSRCPNRPVSIP